MGRKEGSRRSLGAALPDDLMVFEILTRLPMNSLLRFKSVSKAWNYTISYDPDFANLYFQSQRKNNVNHLHPSCLLYDSEYLYSSRGSRFLKLQLEPAFQLQKTPRMTSPGLDVHRPLRLVGSSNGLLCFYQKPNLYALWNLTTSAQRLIKEPLSVPPCEVMCQGFGFIPSSLEYKIVVLCRDLRRNISAYRFFSRTNRWKRLYIDVYNSTNRSLSRSSLRPCQFKKPGVQVGESLHWALRSDDDVFLLAFNLASDSIRLVPLPGSIHIISSHVTVSEIRQRLCVSWLFGKCRQVWTLENYRKPKTDSWKMLFSIDDIEDNKFEYDPLSASRVDLLDAKDNSGRVLWLHGSYCKVLDQQGKVLQEIYLNRCFWVNSAVDYIPSLVSPFPHEKPPKILWRIKRPIRTVYKP